MQAAKSVKAGRSAQASGGMKLLAGGQAQSQVLQVVILPGQGMEAPERFQHQGVHGQEGAEEDRLAGDDRPATADESVPAQAYG